MNKQELIDKAVDEWLHIGALVRVKANKQVLTVERITEDNGVSCSNFKSYCRTELEPCGKGWVNGYQYGVEYETKGKKPDLSGDVIVEAYDSVTKEWWIKSYVASFHWGSCAISRFRIVDERYKPVEIVSEIPEKQKNVTILSEDNQNSENVSDWYDYDKQQAIALPPVKEICDFLHPSSNWIACKILAIDGNDLWIKMTNGLKCVTNFDSEYFRPHDWNCKADEKKQKFINAALVIICESGVVTKNGTLAYDIASKLYDAGFRAPQ